MRAFVLPGLVGLGLLTSVCSPPQTGEEPVSVPTAETVEVVDLTSAFLVALSAADTAALSGLLAPGAMIHSVRQAEGVPVLGAVTRADFLVSLGGEDQRFLERMWDPTVQVQDRVAMVWAPYDFHVNGEFSHCGIDVFSLLKGGDGWQVTGITYNVVREGCAPSPLGSPGRSGS